MVLSPTYPNLNEEKPHNTLSVIYRNDQLYFFLAILKKMFTFAPAFERNDLLAQLV